jgi:ubiquinone/menaquinone biosynthesis C-methylase UbiE
MLQHNNVPGQIEYWNEWHRKINKRMPDWGTHFPLAEEVLPLLKARQASPILDLGCGQCNDAIYFAQQKFEVHAIDFSSVALDKAKAAIETKGIKSIHLYYLDIAAPLPFENGKFRAVYSHLGLHYFDDRTTRFIFSEIYRVLQGDGLLAFNVKSVQDIRYGEGINLGPDIYDYKGHIRHFFRREYIMELLTGWEVMRIEEYKALYGGSSEESSLIKVVASKPTPYT